MRRSNWRRFARSSPSGWRSPRRCSGKPLPPEHRRGGPRIPAAVHYGKIGRLPGVEVGPAIAAMLPPGEHLDLICGEAEEEWIGELLAAWKGLPLRIHRHLALEELAGMLAGARGYLGHDTGISHLAAACGMDCVLLFGPTEPAVWAPRQPRGQSPAHAGWTAGPPGRRHRRHRPPPCGTPGRMVREMGL